MPKDAHDVRAANVRQLTAAGFRVSGSLPVKRDRPKAVRPAREIATRLMAIDAAFTWAYDPEEDAPSERVRSYVARNDLAAQMTKEERAIIRLTRPRAIAKHGDTAGWMLENMWPLAWVLGYRKRPKLEGTFISRDIQRAIVMQFLPRLDGTVDDLLGKSKLRSYDDVYVVEDFFYCAHNAARAAQLGARTVPKGFKPAVGGAIIQERRHALTWCLSPGIAWEDTDLST
jgi:hypothetical protein